MYKQEDKSKKNNQRSSRKESRAVANSSIQRRKSLTGTNNYDNNALRLIQFKAENIHSANSNIIQLMKVSDDHVAAELNHPQANRLFNAATIAWRDGLPGAPLNNAALTGQVAANRDEIDYNQLRNTTLKNSQGLRAWLGREAKEHMYVHEGGKIYTGGRDREKLPHPTLVGGDPDATCAGTMTWNNSSKTVSITNESGHLRPPHVSNTTVELVRSVFPKGKGYKVVKREL